MSFRGFPGELFINTSFTTENTNKQAKVAMPDATSFRAEPSADVKLQGGSRAITTEGDRARRAELGEKFPFRHEPSTFALKSPDLSFSYCVLIATLKSENQSVEKVGDFCTAGPGTPTPEHWSEQKVV